MTVCYNYDFMIFKVSTPPPPPPASQPHNIKLNHNMEGPPLIIFTWTGARSLEISEPFWLCNSKNIYIKSSFEVY